MLKYSVVGDGGAGLILTNIMSRSYCALVSIRISAVRVGQSVMGSFSRLSMIPTNTDMGVKSIDMGNMLNV